MTDTLFYLTLSVSIFSVFAVGAIALGNGRHGSRRARSRIDQVLLRSQGHGKATGLGKASLRRDTGAGFSALESLAKKIMPRQEMLKDRLARTGRDIPMGTYLALNLGLLLVGAAVARLLFGTSGMISASVGVVIGVGLPHYVVGIMAQRRAAKFNEIFPDAIDLIVRGLRSGLPVGESINAVGREMSDPVGIEFRRVVDAVKLGQKMEEALWEISARLAVPEFKFFVISLSVQKDTGGNLAETLGNLSDILRKRRQMRLKIKAMSSEAKASAMILGGLPFLMFGVIFALAPDYASQLLTDPRGKIMLGTGVGIMSVGVFVMQKMVRFEI